MIRRLFLIAFLFVLIGTGAVLYLIAVPQAVPGEAVFVDIPPRTSTAGIAELLRENGVIRFSTPFLVVRAMRPKAVLQAGEYRFAGKTSVWTAFHRIARGDVYYHEVRVPEGSNQFDIASTLEQLGLMKGEEFLAISSSPELIRDLAPSAPSLEGYLFPSTYRITRRTTPKQLARQMTDHFRRVWKELGADGVDVNRLVTLASLVEKETGVPEERPLVASVFENRLARGMRLDCDPTTIYAALLERRYRGQIFRSDLDSTHPYNTYKNPGLPPGPIANPGRESLRAAISPAETNYLFFVAKPNSKAHTFSETLQQHSSAVQVYRNGREK